MLSAKNYRRYNSGSNMGDSECMHSGTGSASKKSTKKLNKKDILKHKDCDQTSLSIRAKKDKKLNKQESSQYDSNKSNFSKDAVN